MVFSSILFLYYFLPVVLILYYIAPRALKNTVLLFSSLVFYAWGEPIYIFLMLFSILFNYVMAIIMDRAKKSKKFIFIFTITANLVILVFYKYSGMLVESINTVLGSNLPYKEIALPIGISFYTFQIISYVIDVYKKDAKVQKNIISIGTYIALFPQLIAGPIVRYNTIDNQLSNRKETFDIFLRGVGIFSVGLSKKVLLANNLGILWENISSLPSGELSVLSAWLGIICYTLQIYFDFSGYSDMAIGLGRMFGFEFEINFNYPYISKNITEFWRRWHISLSTWFKEYVYFPLGGSRCRVLRVCFNLFVVWMLTGLWHGASYNFILWGVYYGIILILEKFVLRKFLRKLPSFLLHFYTIIIVMAGWVLFALTDIEKVFSYLKVMFGGGYFINSSFLYDLRSNFIIILIGIFSCLPIGKAIYNKMPEKVSMILTPLLSALGLIVSTAYLLDSTYNPFLYFRF